MFKRLKVTGRLTMEAYPAASVANFFIDKSSNEGEPITLMKLSKLVYIAHGWSLALLNRPLIKEPIEAWKFGPVIESLYHEFKRFGNTNINMFAIADNIEEEEIVALLNKVWSGYKKYSAYELSNWTHIKDSPWDQVYSPKKKNQVIDNETIKEYFNGLKR
ncbi:MAG: SocA family protein [Proteobacteria bacterium]|nr:SocA family protein [Pseudomonadota bacterium]